ncbi:hypothetical protein BG000_006865, partial [Podila horticola]
RQGAQAGHPLPSLQRRYRSHCPGQALRHDHGPLARQVLRVRFGLAQERRVQRRGQGLGAGGSCHQAHP